jgi:hypothetical protein
LHAVDEMPLILSAEGYATLAADVLDRSRRPAKVSCRPAGTR